MPVDSTIDQELTRKWWKQTVF